MPHAALWVVQLLTVLPFASAFAGFNAARGFVGGAARRGQREPSTMEVSMPHAALWVGQLKFANLCQHDITVSMPHAALWVVQHCDLITSHRSERRFNAARGFVGGAA